ncbi:MAG: XRE family transcriptional regulator [Gordonia sp. (in: high G+C Gram-positive bacteria)]
MIRIHRLNAGLTLAALAEQAGVTKSYLSKLERGRSSPSISVALRIAEVLGVDVAEVFADSVSTATDVVVERSTHRLRATSADLPVYDPVAAIRSGKQMHPFIVHPTQTTEPPVRHPGEEFVYVLTGTAILTVNETDVNLDAGDCAYFSAGDPHRLRSTSPQPASVLVVASMPGHATREN